MAAMAAGMQPVRRILQRTGPRLPSHGLPRPRRWRHNPANCRVRPGLGGKQGDHMCLAGCERAVREALTRRGFFRGAAATVGFAATGVSGTAVAAPKSFTTVVDLTHTMSPDFPTFNGKPGIEMQRESVLKKDGYNLYWWRVSEHVGTHMDAPI